MKPTDRRLNRVSEGFAELVGVPVLESQFQRKSGNQGNICTDTAQLCIKNESTLSDS
jgi:hypothetical protein